MVENLRTVLLGREPPQPNEYSCAFVFTEVNGGHPAVVKLQEVNCDSTTKASDDLIKEVDRMIFDYYQSAEFHQDLLNWVSTPRRSAILREQIVRQMNANRTALGCHLDNTLHVSQTRFIYGEMSYEELLVFIEAYVRTMKVNPRGFG